MSILNAERQAELCAAADELQVVGVSVVTARILLNHLIEVKNNKSWKNLRVGRRGITRNNLLSSMSAVLRNRQLRAAAAHDRGVHTNADVDVDDIANEVDDNDNEVDIVATMIKQLQSQPPPIPQPLVSPMTMLHVSILYSTIYNFYIAIFLHI